MVSKKVKIIVGVVVLVAIVAIVAAAMGGSDETEVRYDYTVDFEKSFESTTGGTQTASEGMTYLINTWVVANDGYKDGFSTNDLIFQVKATIGGVSYSNSVIGYLHPDYKLVTIEEGGSARFVEVFEVPEGTTASDVTISWDYVDFGFDPKMERDDSLL